MEAGVQLGTTIQAQSLVKVEGNLMELETSIEKIADVQGAGFARVDDDLDLMGKRVNMVKVDVDSLDESMKSILEHLEILEKQNTAKDKLIFDLDCRMTKLSEALVQRSGGENIHKVSSGSGTKEDPFKLEIDEEETWDDCPQGESPEEEERLVLAQMVTWDLLCHVLKQPGEKLRMKTSSWRSLRRQGDGHLFLLMELLRLSILLLHPVFFLFL